MPNQPTDLAAILDELGRLNTAVALAPWAWESTGDKDNSWGIGTALDDNDQPIAGQIVEHFDEESGEFSELPDIIDVVCQGDESLLDAQFIVAMRNALPRLLAAARLAQELTAILGDEPVGRARWLASREDLRESTSHDAAVNLAHSRGLEADELRSTLAERDARIAKLEGTDALKHMTMQRDVMCGKLNEYIDKTVVAERECRSLRERVAELTKIKRTARLELLQELYQAMGSIVPDACCDKQGQHYGIASCREIVMQRLAPLVKS